ncbi:RDD family protein [Thiocapsa imhoffii]|uniref:RDD family protein n=1 Tax=Thiocapsa imhoffii TaxID=382777 RepID=A0A9X1B7C1_9GAMM|nr:RDD family protein [Thiocapsa imhoffii]
MPPSSIDTIRFHETPEGIDLALRVAGPVVRALALVIDVLIRLAILVVALPLLALPGVGAGIFLLLLFGLEWLYPVFYEVRHGATPGKRALGLTVVHEDGTPVGLSASLIRNLLRVVDFLPLLYAVGLVSCLVDRDFRRLGDLAAGTLVIHHTPPQPQAQGLDVPPRRPPPGLPSALQQAILAFAERGRSLSPARRGELAEILAGPHGLRGSAAVAAVEGWAAWIASGAGDAPALPQPNPRGAQPPP